MGKFSGSIFHGNRYVIQRFRRNQISNTLRRLCRCQNGEDLITRKTKKMGKRCARKRLRVGRALDTETAPHGKMTSAHRDINSRQSQTEPVGRGSSRSLTRKTHKQKGNSASGNLFKFPRLE